MLDTCLIVWIIVASQTINNGPAFPVYIVQEKNCPIYVTYDPKLKDHPKTVGIQKSDSK